ncbi:MAG TPA: hypothetical protein VKI44_12185 [Acetobacteraceae bacterium]|nr:hypothetical protein [Acetobacteraceae bacterium]
MSVTFTRDRIPNEHVRQTREFCERIRAAEVVVIAAIRQIVQPLRLRMASQPSPRREMLADARRRWLNEVPASGRLSIDTELARNALHIRETRITTGSYRRDDWDGRNAEEGLILQKHELLVGKRVFTMDTVPMALIGNHALGRWFQRSRDPSESALLNDFGLILKQRQHDQGRAFVAVSRNGEWRMARRNGHRRRQRPGDPRRRGCGCKHS